MSYAKRKKDTSHRIENLFDCNQESHGYENPKVPGPAKLSGITYSTLRRILELNTVADYGQMSKIAEAPHTPLSKIAEDTENPAKDPKIIAEFDAGYSNPTDNDADLVDDITANPNPCDLAANRDAHKDFETETSKDQIPISGGSEHWD